ncbi:c6 transcription factor [Ceraceosorus bombacis]|uniref:C6 transcription factor n=1 Tax=Ceraceosorus bombacis TaxID=401625 RepID=A0A0N7L9V7_9BASI|nr:c6 transcription factor [Ceraceosorus bombacis]
MSGQHHYSSGRGGADPYGYSAGSYSQQPLSAPPGSAYSAFASSSNSHYPSSAHTVHGAGSSGWPSGGAQSHDSASSLGYSINNSFYGAHPHPSDFGGGGGGSSSSADIYGRPNYADSAHGTSSASSSGFLPQEPSPYGQAGSHSHSHLPAAASYGHLPRPLNGHSSLHTSAAANNLPTAAAAATGSASRAASSSSRPVKPKKPPLGRTDVSSAADPEKAKEVLLSLRARMPDSTEPAPSCDRCRRRKIRCDREKPTCGNCQQSGRVCTTEDVLRKRGPPSKKERQIMEAAGIVFHGARPKQKKKTKSDAGSKGATGSAPKLAKKNGNGAPPHHTDVSSGWNNSATGSASASETGHASAPDWTAAQPQQQQQQQPGYYRPAEYDHSSHAAWAQSARSRPASPAFAASHGAGAGGAGSMRSADSAYTWDGRPAEHHYGDNHLGAVAATSLDWSHSRHTSVAGQPVAGNAFGARMADSQQLMSAPAPGWSSSSSSSSTAIRPPEVLYVVDANGELKSRDVLRYYRSVADLVGDYPDSIVPSADPDTAVPRPQSNRSASFWHKTQSETPHSRWQVDRLISHELANILLDEFLGHQNHIHPFVYEPRVRSIFAALQQLANERLDGFSSGSSVARSWSPALLRNRQALILSILAMSSCISDGLPLSSGGAALGWEFGHGCYQLARGLLAPHNNRQGWSGVGQDAMGGPEGGALERIQALALVGIYLANEASREHTIEVLKAAWDTGRSMDALRSRSVDAYDPRRWDEVDREMLKRSLWGCFMMLQMVRAANENDGESDYPRASDVSQMDFPLHLPPHIESEPALDTWTSELRVDAILASVLDSPLAAPPVPTKLYGDQQAMHDVHLCESWAQELLGQLEHWASSAPCYHPNNIRQSSSSSSSSRSIARNFNIRKSRSTHQLARSLIRQGLTSAGSMLDIGEDARCDSHHAFSLQEQGSDRVAAWLATTPSYALKAIFRRSS